MKKIHDILIVYNVEALPKGCRKSRIMHVQEKVPFEIEQMDIKDAPLLLVANTVHNSNFRLFVISGR